MIAGYGLAAVSKPLLALAYVWPVVLGARVLDRFGKGLRGSPRDALIADSTAEEMRGRAFGFHRSADSIGAVLGPLAALAILAWMHGNYRAAFLIAFVPGLLSTLLILPVQDSRRPVRNVALTANLRSGWANPRLRRFLLVLVLFGIGNSSDMFLILRAKQLGASDAVAVLMFAAANTLSTFSPRVSGRDRFRPVGRKGSDRRIHCLRGSASGIRLGAVDDRPVASVRHLRRISGTDRRRGAIAG